MSLPSASILRSHFNVGDAQKDIFTVSRITDKHREDSIAASSRNMRAPLSREACIAKAWQDHPEIYKRLKAAGKLGDCKRTRRETPNTRRKLRPCSNT
jgi:hypothetical protein